MAPALLSLNGIGLTLPASLARSVAPGLGLTLGETGLLLEGFRVAGADHIEDGFGSALGLPAALSRTMAPALVFGLALPAALTGTMAPGLGLRFGLTLLLGIIAIISIVVIELSVEVELVVESLRVVLSKGDEVGKLVDAALGHESSSSRHVAEVAGGVSGLKTTRGLNCLGESLSGALGLPASLTGSMAPWNWLWFRGWSGDDAREDDGESSERELHDVEGGSWLK